MACASLRGHFLKGGKSFVGSKPDSCIRRSPLPHVGGACYVHAAASSRQYVN
jgi:hypothetical protein